MKKLIVQFFAVLLLFVSFCGKGMAQKAKGDTTIIKTWNDYLAKARKQKDLNDPATVKQLVIEDEATKKVRQQLTKEPIDFIEKKKKETGLWNEYVSSAKNAKTGMNLMPMFDEVPSPVTNLLLAAQTGDERYDAYIKKVDQEGKKLAEQSMKGNKLMELYEKEGEEGVKKKAIAQSDNNVFIQQMGGTENIMNMSEAERKAAGQKMADNIKQNPGMLTGNKDPGMNAMMQKLMNDKEYAQRFSKMSQAEKEVEMKKYMTVQQPDPNFDLAAHNAKVEQTKKEVNAIKYSQEIVLLGARVNKRLQAAADQYAQNIKFIDDWKEGVNKMIGGWYASKYKAIPIIELGEYGHDKDPEQVQALDLAYTYLTYYLLNGPEMQLKGSAWAIFRVNCKYALAEANDFADTYKWGNKASDKNIFGPDADQQAANNIIVIYGMMSELAKFAKNFTREAKRYQNYFNEKTYN